MENHKSPEFAEFITDPMERLGTVFARLRSIDEAISNFYVEQNEELTNAHKATHYWEFLNREQAFFDCLRGRKFDYWSVCDSDSTDEVISDLVFDKLHFKVGIDDEGDVKVDITIGCVDNSTSGKSITTIIDFMPGDTIGLQPEGTVRGLRN